MNISIIEKNDDFLVIEKPADLPSAPLKSLEEDTALTQAIRIFPQIMNVKGRKNIEYGLLHRLDTVTNGLLLIALNQDFFDEILKIQQEERFIKTYTAICNYNSSVKEGFPEFPIKLRYKINDVFLVESYFRSFGKGQKEVRPVIENTKTYSAKKTNFSKKYSTNIKILNISDNSFYVECKISQGFRHQVRNHLAWSNLPIIGDKLYNPSKNDENIKFWAVGLDFNYKGKNFSFRIDKF